MKFHSLKRQPLFRLSPIWILNYKGIKIVTLKLLFSLVHFKEPLYFSITEYTLGKPNPCKFLLLFVVDGYNAKLEVALVEGFVSFINKK